MHDVSSWLGIALLATFSLGLSLFMRLEWNKAPREEPPDFERWVRCDESVSGSVDTVVERRVLRVERGWLRRRVLVEQRRVRRLSDGVIVKVLPERRSRVGKGGSA